MNKTLIDLQIGISAVCAIVLQNEYKKLTPIVSMEANVSDKFLFTTPLPPFANKINELTKKYDKCYFVIKNFDLISKEKQKRFLPIIKDRCLYNYVLPNNCIIILTVQNTSSLVKIDTQIYKHCIVCI